MVLRICPPPVHVLLSLGPYRREAVRALLEASARGGCCACEMAGQGRSRGRCDLSSFSCWGPFLAAVATDGNQQPAG
jgi:hypothetical protein